MKQEPYGHLISASGTKVQVKIRLETDKDKVAKFIEANRGMAKRSK